MTSLVNREFASYQLVKTAINWIVYCSWQERDWWIGSISFWPHKHYDAVRVSVASLPPTEPLETGKFWTVQDALNWIIDLSERDLQLNNSNASMQAEHLAV